MSKKFKQVSTGLTLVCNRKDVIAQYEKYPDQYIPLDEKKSTKKTPDKKPDEQSAAPKTKTEAEEKAKS